jgi:small subunit ribosomal protein S2
MPKKKAETSDEKPLIVEDSEEKKEKKKAVKKEKIDEKEAQVSDLEAKRKALLEKAAKLKEKLDGSAATSEELKEKVKGKKKEDFLVPLEDYVKSGIYLGTKVVTPDMRRYVYRRRADGLAIFNTDLIDEKLKEGIKFLNQFNPEDIIIVCKRQAGWRAVQLFSEITGIRVFTKKYPAGVLTNPQLPDFFEVKCVFICDPWLDKNALNDASNVNINVLMICDTNNFSKFTNQIIIGNNKSARSLGLIFYLLAKEYAKHRGIKTKIPSLEFFEGEEEQQSAFAPSTAEKLKKENVLAKEIAEFEQ